jgi:hypothetical protein
MVSLKTRLPGGQIMVVNLKNPQVYDLRSLIVMHT